MISEAEQIYQCGLFSKQAYDPKSISFTDYYTSDTFNFGVGVLEDGCKVVACAGSNDARDWIDDATAIPFWMPELGVTMHLGFTEGYKEAFAWLLPKIAGGAAVGMAASRWAKEVGDRATRLISAMSDGVMP